MNKKPLPKVNAFGSFTFIFVLICFPLLPTYLYEAIKCVVQYEKIKYIYNLNPEQYSEEDFHFITENYNSANAFLNLMKLVLGVAIILVLFIFFIAIIKQ